MNQTELIPHLDGKVIISADHGELLGERVDDVVYRGKHPPNVDHPALFEVPWFEVEK